MTAQFTETEWPKAILENMTEMLGSLNEQLVKGITDARGRFLKRLDVNVISQWAGVEEAEKLVEVPISVVVLEESSGAIGEERVDVTKEHNETAAASETVSDMSRRSSVEVPPLLSPDATESEKLQKLMDIAPLSSHESHTSGLVDTLAFKRQHNPRKRTLLNSTADIPTDSTSSSPTSTSTTSTPPSTPSTQPAAQPTSHKMSLTRYRLARTEERKKELAANEAVGKEMTKIGLVYLCGAIMRGDEQFGSNTVAKAIAEAAEDEEVGAVCLRIGEFPNWIVAFER